MFFPKATSAWPAGQPVDMRKSFDGLYALTRQQLGQDPLSGDLFVFISRRAIQVKVLYFDRSGLCVWSKRLESGRYISDWSAVRTHEMDWTSLKLLLEGIVATQQRKRFRRTQATQVLSSRPGKRYNLLMPHALAKRLLSADELAALSSAQLVELVGTQAQLIESLQQQLDWFKRQLFGSKSERFITAANARQLQLAELVSQSPPRAEPRKAVAAHTRAVPTRDPAADGESLPFFDESRSDRNHHAARCRDRGLGGRSIRDDRREGQLPPGATPGQLCGTEVCAPGGQTPRHQCAELPAGTEQRDRGQPRRCQLHRRPAARQDRLRNHLPLYRQHQRLSDAGITVSRPWLTRLGPPGRQPARAHLHCPVRIDPCPARHRDGRDADQSRTRRSGQDEGDLLLATVW